MRIPFKVSPLNPLQNLTEGMSIQFTSPLKIRLFRREEWRKEIDSRLAMMRVTNNERAVLIRDNKTLRTTVECGRTVSSLAFPSLYSSRLIAFFRLE